MKTAIITGVCGQDGAYLSQLLISKGYRVVGWARRNASLDGLHKLGVMPEIVNIDICDPFHVDAEIERVRPDEIYNLAAQSHVGMSFKNPMQTCSVNYGGYLNVLLAARKHVPDARIYQAGTSEMFGYAAGEGMVSEKHPFMPMSPYAISKVAAYWAGVNARFEADQFVSNGILFNHESPLRGKDFVTRKIADFVKNPVGVLELGNLNSVRDWGHARDYVQSMWLMLQHDRPDDFVVATGETMTVRNFVIKTFAATGKVITFLGRGLDEIGYVEMKPIVRVSKEFYRPNDLAFLKGDASKARQVLGWKPECSIEQLIEEMVSA
jgi:GDPmannose 4,6-dehydratase